MKTQGTIRVQRPARPCVHFSRSKSQLDHFAIPLSLAQAIDILRSKLVYQNTVDMDKREFLWRNGLLLEEERKRTKKELSIVIFLSSYIV